MLNPLINIQKREGTCNSQNGTWRNMCMYVVSITKVSNVVFIAQYTTPIAM